MSDDRSIFIFEDNGVFYVVKHTLSAMPEDIPQIVRDGITCYSEFSSIFPNIHLARSHASRLGIKLREEMDSTEYGIMDWTLQTAREMLLGYDITWEDCLDRALPASHFNMLKSYADPTSVQPVKRRRHHR